MALGETRWSKCQPSASEIGGQLNAGAIPKTAQQWERAPAESVLFDTYIGVLHGDAEVSLQRVERALDDALRDMLDDQTDTADRRTEAGDGGGSSQADRNDHGGDGQQGVGDDNQ